MAHFITVSDKVLKAALVVVHQFHKPFCRQPNTALWQYSVQNTKTTTMTDQPPSEPIQHFKLTFVFILCFRSRYALDVCTNIIHLLQLQYKHCYWLRFYAHSTQNRSFWRRSPSEPLGLVWKNKTSHNKSTYSPIKQNVQQHKINTKKARFSRLLWHPACKRSGPILVLTNHKFVTYLLKTLTHLLTAPDPHGAQALYMGDHSQVNHLGIWANHPLSSRHNE